MFEKENGSTLLWFLVIVAVIVALLLTFQPPAFADTQVFSASAAGQNEFECYVDFTGDPRFPVKLSMCLLYNFDLVGSERNLRGEVFTLEGMNHFQCEIEVYSDGTIAPANCVLSDFEME